MFESWKDSDLD